MKGTELLETYPKAAQVVKQWFLEQMLEGLKDDNLPEDFKKYVREQGIDNDKVGKLIDLSPRGLYDVFDSHKIYIGTVVDELNGFWWTINDKKSTVGYQHRKNCDNAVIQEVFKLLNDKL